MALSYVATEHNFCRPTIVEAGGKLHISEGRHALAELRGNGNFTPNSTCFEDREKIVILTGPNASGKSIYLKQVTVYSNFFNQELSY